MDAAQNIDYGGDQVSAGTGNKWKPLIAGDCSADAGVKTHRADIQAIMIIAADQIKFCRFAVQQPIKVRECTRIRKNPDKIIAGTDRKTGDRGIGEVCGTIYHLVQCPITAAGVQPHGIPARSGGMGDCPAVAWSAGYLNLIVASGELVLNHRSECGSAVLLSCSGVQNEKMLHPACSITDTYRDRI